MAMNQDAPDAIDDLLDSRCADFRKRWSRAEFGPAHVVLSDGNHDSWRWCVGLIDAVLLHRAGAEHGASQKDAALLARVDWYDDHGTDELQATRMFLISLGEFYP